MNKNKLFFLVAGLVAFAFVSRMLPHLPNATPISAIALVGGLYLGRRWTLILPILGLLLSDFFIGFYDWKIMLSVYGSFILIGMASFLINKYKNIFIVSIFPLLSSLIFFFITNTAVWAFSSWYAKNISGLLYSYELGLPFLRNMLLGDIFYTALLVSIFEFVLKKVPAKSLQAV